MSLVAHRVIKNTIWLYAKMGITMFISFYTTRLLLSALGVSDFGIYNIVGGVISLLGFINGSMASASQRFMSFAEGSGDKEKQKYIFNISLVLHFGTAMFAIAAFTIVGYLFFNGILNIPDERKGAALIVYGSMVVSTAFTVMSVPYEAVMNAHENMRYYAFVGIFEALLKLVVAFIVVYTLIDKLVVYGILMTLIPFITLTIMRVYCHRHYEECVVAPRRYFKSELMKEMTEFAGWSFFSSCSSVITMQGIAILLNMFGGVIVNAAHGIANQLTGQLMVFSNNMLKALNPVIVKHEGAGKTYKMLEAAVTGNKLSFFMFAILAIPFMVETPFILKLWLVQVPQWSVIFVRMVLLRMMLSQLSVTLGTCVQATGKIRNMTIFSTLIWMSPIILGYYLYHISFPIYTIYILLILMVVLLTCNVLYFCKKYCGLHVRRYLFHAYLPSCGVAAITIVLLYCIHCAMPESFLRMLVVLFTGIMFYSALTYIIVFDDKERVVIHGAIYKLKQKTGRC